MKVLLYDWNKFGKVDLKEALLEMGYLVDTIHYAFTNYLKDEYFEKTLKDLIITNQYEFMLSFNYFPIISDICNSLKFKYVAWIWDSPLLQLFFKSVYHPYNYIFIFDKALYNQLKSMNVNTVYYMPLAVNVNRLDGITITDEEKNKYNHDVCFVGSLYDDNHYNEIKQLSDYLYGYFDGIMKAQMNIYGYNFMEEMLSEEIVTEFMKYVSIDMEPSFIGKKESIIADRFLNVKITEMERKQILQTLTNYFDVTLYSDSETKAFPKINNKGYVEYYEAMPKVFKKSKINLNITLRSIKTGIPLRIFDILGAGGFLITNYQSELTDYFEIDKDLVCYESLDDLINKIEYYLNHEEERNRIAKNGHEKVKKYHTYQVRVQSMLDIVFGK